jgi:tetratricopeptide (TPR) repeat protein
VAVAALLAGVSFLWGHRAPQPDAIWAAGEADLNAGRIDRAEVAVERLGRLRAPTPLDWMLRAQLALAQDRTEEGLAALGRVPDDHPVSRQARVMAGQAELKRNRASIAEGYFRNALRIDSTLVQAHRELIYIYGYQRRRAELDAEFRALSGLTELTFDNLLHWCLLRSNSWEAEKAVETLAKFVEADPEDQRSRLALAAYYRRSGMLDEAESAIAPLPDTDPEALALRVMLAFDRDQEDRAVRLLESGPPNQPILARLRGRLALVRRDGAAAVRQFRIAHADAPEDRDTTFGLINAFILVGDEQATAPLREIAKGLEWLNTLVHRAATLQGRNDPKLVHELGAACAALGHNAEARAWYKLAIARDPLDAESQRASFRLGASRPPLRPRLGP